MEYCPEAEARKAAKFRRILSGVMKIKGGEMDKRICYLCGGRDGEMTTVYGGCSNEFHHHTSYTDCHAESQRLRADLSELQEATAGTIYELKQNLATVTRERDEAKAECRTLRNIAVHAAEQAEDWHKVADSRAAAYAQSLNEIRDLITAKNVAQSDLAAKSAECEANAKDAALLNWLCTERLGWFSRFAPIRWKNQTMKEALQQEYDAAIAASRTPADEGESNG